MTIPFAGLSGDGIPFLGVIVDNDPNKKSLSEEVSKILEAAFKAKMYIKEGVELTKFESIEQPFIRIKTSVSSSDFTMFYRMTIELVELVEIKRGEKAYQTLTPVWVSSYSGHCPINAKAWQELSVAALNDGATKLAKAFKSAKLPE